MDAGRGSYCCGLVLGVALGVAGTHVALSGRPVHPPARLPDLSIGARHEAQAPQIQLPPLETLVPELRTAFAPEPSTVHAIATVPAESDPAGPAPIDRSPIDASAIEPPRQLPEMSDAEPLSTEKPPEDAELRAFIQDELQTLAASEHDIWYETLRGLAREDATEILRIWKLTRGSGSGAGWPDLKQLASLPGEAALPAPPRKETVPTPAPASVRAAPTPSSDRKSHQAELRRLCHLNLANAMTPGFKRRELIIFEHPDSPLQDVSPAKPPKAWINASQGKLTATQRSLDCAIEGKGFFQVRRGEETLLTRCGRFVLDDAGRLSLPRSHGDPCPIEPPITLPAHFERLQVLRTGDIQTTVDGKLQLIGTIALVCVHDPSGLEPVGDNLLRATVESGPVRSLPADERGGIVQNSIEESNVDPLEERRKLETLAAQSAPL